MASTLFAMHLTPPQRANFEFFLTVGMGVNNTEFPPPAGTDLIITVAAGPCTPCHALQAALLAPAPVPPGMEDLLSAVYIGKGITLLHRTSNEGMDLGSHNISLTYLATQHRRVKTTVFINSSVRGPFMPNYLPPTFSWVDAFVRPLGTFTKAVASSLTCLPALDAGVHK